MSRFAQVFASVAFAAVVLAQTGCGSVGIFGGSSPQYKLIPEAEAFRNGATPPPLLPRELAKVPLAEYFVEPGDVLLVQPVDFDSPVRVGSDQPILPDGRIDLGVYGRPMVAGKTVPQIEAEVNALVKAREKTDQPVTVRLISRQSKVYYVLGEVNSPGSFPLIGRETVLDGLMAAGGLTRQAQPKKVILVRPSHPDGCREVLPVCYPQIVQLGDTHTNYQLRPGDRIYVPSKGTLEGLFPSHDEDTPPCCKGHVPCYPAAGGGAACDTGDCATGAAAAPAPMIAPSAVEQLAK